MLCLLANGCSRRSQPVASPDAIYLEIEKNFFNGNLARAEQDADMEMHHFSLVDPLWSARFRLELAKVRFSQGRSADVVILLNFPLPSASSKEMFLREKLLLALAQDRLGHEAQANKLLSDAQALHPGGLMQAEMLGTQGSLALDRGDLGTAEQLFQRALDGALSVGDKFLQTKMWNNLGVVALQQEHYGDALARCTHASSLADAIGAKLIGQQAFGNLGWIDYQIGDFGRALQNMQAAEARAAAIGASLDEAQALINEGMIQSRMGDTVAALASYKRALSLAETLHDQDHIGDTHLAIAYLQLHTDTAAAVAHVRDAATIYAGKQDSSEAKEVALLESLLLVEQGRTAEAKQSLLALERRAVDAPWLRWEAENTLAKVYAAANEQGHAGRWFERAISTFERQRHSVAIVGMQLPYFENGSDLYLSYMEYLIRERHTDEALQVLDRSRAEMLAEGLHRQAGGSGTPMQPRTVAARLHGTILTYCLRPGRSFLWAIDARHEEFRELPGSEIILPLVERHTEAILASKDLLAQKDSTGRALYDHLVRPAESMIKPNGRVYLIPDKGLSRLNFETLIATGEHPHYWIEDVSVTNARSLRLLAARRSWSPHAEAKGKMLLIGDPVYRGKEYPELPNAAAEMEGVSSHFPPRQRMVFSGAAASPAAYIGNKALRYGYIHFVAHATADAMNPLDSALVLSNAAGSGSPYKLYASDVLKQPLDAELVTISSCYGSGVRNYAGEGVVGLVWAFLRAGAHSVIGALWEVSDVSTPKLMDSMYLELLRGRPPDAALRSAKLAMVHDPSVFRKPLYWAAFQLYAGQ